MMLAGIINITARRESEQERDQQQKALERSNADLEEFAWTASHDLKAPLRAISHLVQWIADDIEPTAVPETLENLRLLQARMARMQMLLDGLLAYSRVGHTNTTVEDVDIGEVVRDVVSMLAAPRRWADHRGRATAMSQIDFQASSQNSRGSMRRG